MFSSWRFSILLLAIISLLGCCSALSIDVVLLGCNGNLAQKYLFQSLHDISASYEHKNFRVHASSRQPSVDMNKILDNSLNQPSDAKFRAAVSYVQLKAPKQFADLCNSIPKSTDVIVFYLSIPPYAFSGSVQMISEGCTDFLKAGKIRVIIEKPFGKDLMSAMKMSMSITSHLPDAYAFRIDHYLGKGIVREILPFRMANNELNKLFSDSAVSSIEVSMLEKVDCKGRSSYYDGYGVVRDVMQNHMTEMLLLSTLILPESIADSDAITEAKIAILQDGFSNARSLLGQYSTYSDEVKEETEGSIPRSETPTFAAITFSLNSPRWRKVPITFISGKKLSVKASYLRMIFKRREPNSATSSGHFISGGYQEVVFYVGGDLSSEGFIVCSKGLNCRPSATMVRSSVPEGIQSIVTSHADQYEAFKSRRVSSSAYTNLIADAILSRKENYLSEKHLIASWKFWDEILKLTENVPVRRYASWKEIRFAETNGHISWSDGLLADDEQESAPSIFPRDMGTLSDGGPRESSENAALMSTERLSFWLAKLIYNASVNAAMTKGNFHIAFPGGSSPLPLFSKLVDLSPSLDWEKVHIWLTDERCVDRSSTDSNMNTIDRYLLRHVQIPLSNIHKIPLGVTEKQSCVSNVMEGVDSAQLYENEYQALIESNGGFDFTVLGVGSDGHIASLFADEDLKSERYVVYSLKRELQQRRVTLTLKSLLASKHLAVLITGEEKRSIAKEILKWLRNKLYEIKPSRPYVHLLKHSAVRLLIDRNLV